MPQTARRPRVQRQSQLARALFREQLVFPATTRVDREAGIIYGVKIVGVHSPNNHLGTDGRPISTEGTDYPLDMLEANLSKYEGAIVNLGPHVRGNEEPDPQNVFAWVKECRVERGANPGVFGNLCFLDAKHEMAVRIMNAAEQKPDAFALSHNASAAYEPVDGRAIVKEIYEVRSIDIVTKGGTVASLFESQTMPKPKKAIPAAAFKAALLNLLPNHSKRIHALLEADYMGPPLRETEAPGGMGGPAPAGVMGGAAGEMAPEAEDYATHIGRAIVEIVNDQSMSLDDKKKKVLGALKLLDETGASSGDGDGSDATADLPAQESDDEGEAVEAKTDQKPPDKPAEKKDDKAKAEESLKRDVAELKAQNARLKANHEIAILCESLSVAQPEETILEILRPMDAKKRAAFIERMRPALGKKGPRSIQQGSFQESQDEPIKLDSFLDSITR